LVIESIPQKHPIHNPLTLTIYFVIMETQLE
jgi:hypothetical protein